MCLPIHTSLRRGAYLTINILCGRGVYFTIHFFVKMTPWHYPLCFANGLSSFTTNLCGLCQAKVNVNRNVHFNINVQR